ncbi:hypothetical protein M011DRAFT_525768 [Sporormia fimetaria CBS 119925]|uniref:Uncharacterized protein n=1 Tax=Sporormia fimetaria CBS 119925 TaxID=1340428 RepID=A0A6A6VED3_9PLEO|nr:hypothetical protein M011DRAFT_525768 [Sporormia fimetaria CBS 119925]
MAGVRKMHQATVEEYHSTDESDRDILVDEKARRSPATPGQANVAAKRSQTSDLGKDKTPAAEKVINIDLQSDSGYSSHTAATMSSADSAPSAKAQSPPAAPVAPTPTPSADPPAKRRPTLSREDRHSSNSSPRKPLTRSGSMSQSRPSRERQSSTTCKDPHCTECPASRGRRAPRPSPLDSGLDISYPPFDDVRSQHSDPNPVSSYLTPQTPTYTRQSDPYRDGTALVQPNRTRRSSSTARPMSYAGEAPPGHPYNGWSHPGMLASYQSPPLDVPVHGMPPSMSAYHQMAAYNAMMGTTPPNFHQMPMTPGYDMQPGYDMHRPPMPTRNSSSFSTRRPVSEIYGQPILNQDTAKLPSARYAPAPEDKPSKKKVTQSRFDTDSESSEEEVYEKAIMGPPPRPKASHHRQPSSRELTSSKAERRMSQSLALEPPRRDRERERDRESRLSRTTTAPARSKSITRVRPALVQHPKAQSALETSRNAQLVVESSGRRRSYQHYEKQYRSEKRRSRMYEDDGGVALEPQRRQRTDPTLGKDDLRDVENEIEAYQQRTRGSATPFNEQVHKEAKRGSRLIAGPADAKSSRSRGSDKASRVSQSNRTTVTNGGTGEIRLRVDASAPLSLQLNGDMEGRNISIEPTEDGMANIIIGERETSYRSERGSIYGTSGRSSVSRSERPDRPRRTHDEQSIKTSRSSLTRRERDREEPRPLARSEKRYYDEGRRF